MDHSGNRSVRGNNHPDPMIVLANRFQMTRAETEQIVSIAQDADPSLESLQHAKVKDIIRQRKGRWVQVRCDEKIASVFFDSESV